MPRPSSILTEEQQTTAKMMAAYGIVHEQIALVLDIAPKTLEKHLHKELRRKPIQAHMNIRKALYSMATSGHDTGATIYADKLWAGICARYGESEGQPMLAPQIIIRKDGEECNGTKGGQDR